ncbi:MAG: hypothetical protein GY935_14010, partial [Gammaproteobacteria bacterium]|nr:hypothetical protein [Gammaproteobacteria bacterium]
MKKLATVIFGASALIFSAVGNAAVFDFLALSNVAGAEKGGDPLVFMDGGVTLTATGSDGSGATYAYLDGGAGLGVCNTIDAGLQCDPSNDDNVTVGEVLKVVI